MLICTFLECSRNAVNACFTFRLLLFIGWPSLQAAIKRFKNRSNKVFSSGIIWQIYKCLLLQIEHKEDGNDTESSAFTPLPSSTKSLDKPVGGSLSFSSLSHMLINQLVGLSLSLIYAHVYIIFNHHIMFIFIASFGKSKYIYYGKHSEGNRFIRNKDLWNYLNQGQGHFQLHFLKIITYRRPLVDSIFTSSIVIQISFWNS